MNLSSIVGIVLGFFLIIGSIMLGGDVTRYFDPASILIVLGGVISATMVSYSFEQLKAALPLFKDAFVKPKIEIRQDAERLIDMANIARREGLLALDGQELGDPFLQKGMEMVIDGTDPELVKTILESESALVDEKDQLAIKVLLSMSAYSPAFGMVGTLIGLINMLMFLSDTASLGPSMATALITTFYGVILANLFFTPLANKLRTASAERQNRLAMIMEGILSIQDGENPRIIKEKLGTYIADKNAGKPQAAAAGAGGIADAQETIPG